MLNHTGFLAKIKSDNQYINQLIEHVRTPLYLNAYAWMISTGLSSALGIVYWILAARLYPTENYGISSVLISGMIFLSGVMQFDFSNVVTRFLPVGGENSYKLVLYGYLASIVASLLAGLLLISNWVPTLREFFLPVSGQFIQILFVLSIIVWGIFSIQDSVFSGLRNAVWVPIENVTYAIVKIGLLIYFSTAFPENGIYLSWIIPVIVLIIPMNWLIFYSVMPKYLEQNKENQQEITFKSVLNYASGNYIASIFYLSSIRLLPVMITYISTPANGAFFYSAWTISNAIKLVVINMTKSLTVEGSLDEEKLNQISQKLMKMIAFIIGPGVLITIIFAPYILGLYGSEYATQGTPVLRLMLLSIIPGTFNLVYLSMARVERSMRDLIGVQFAITALTLIGSYLGLQRYGVYGVGLAIFASETIVALYILIRKTNTLDLQRYFSIVKVKFDQRIKDDLFAPIVISILGLIVSIYFLRQIDYQGINDFGIISILPFGYYVGLALIVSGFFISLQSKQFSEKAMVFHIVLLVIILHGIPIITQDIPRFHVAYRHVGISEYITRNGSVNPRINVYFNWPSFFILMSMISEISGLKTALSLTQWAYIFFNLTFVSAIYGIQQATSKNLRKIWLAIYLYVITNWVGQDYLAPQALGLFFYLIIIFLLLGYLRGENQYLYSWLKLPVRLFKQVSSFISLQEDVDQPGMLSTIKVWQHSLGLFLLLIVFAAIVPSHQLSPLFIFLGVCILIAFGRSVHISLPFFMGLILLVWYVYFANTYLNGHLDKIISETGASNSISAGVSKRVGGSADHLLVVRFRLVLTALIFVLGSCGFLLRWKKQQLELTEILLVFFPFSLITVLTYGGEFIMRAFFFSLPFVVSGAAYLFLPSDTSKLNFKNLGFLAIITPVLLGLFIVSKYGNERMDYHTEEELTVTDYLYDIAEPGSVLFAGSEETPWKYKNVDKHKHHTIENYILEGDTEGLIELLREHEEDGSYVLILRSQIAHMEMFRSAPPNQWGIVKEQLESSEEITFIYEGTDAYIFSLTSVFNRNVAIRASNSYRPEIPAPTLGAVVN